MNQVFKPGQFSAAFEARFYFCLDPCLRMQYIPFRRSCHSHHPKTIRIMIDKIKSITPIKAAIIKVVRITTTVDCHNSALLGQVTLFNSCRVSPIKFPTLTSLFSKNAEANPIRQRSSQTLQSAEKLAGQAGFGAFRPSGFRSATRNYKRKIFCVCCELLTSNPVICQKLAGQAGFEPATSGFGDRRSSQLELLASNLFRKKKKIPHSLN